MDKLSFLRLPEVKARTGLSRSTIYAYIQASKFPNSISLGPRAVGWLESDLDAWMAERIELSHANDGKVLC